MTEDTRRIPAPRDVLMESLEIGLHRTADRFAQEVGAGPQGRDTSRAYPGEALLQRLDKAPDRLAAALAEPHIPDLAPKPEPEQIDMRLGGQHRPDHTKTTVTDSSAHHGRPPGNAFEYLPFATSPTPPPRSTLNGPPRTARRRHRRPRHVRSSAC
jgi:hypothetical protein